MAAAGPQQHRPVLVAWPDPDRRQLPRPRPRKLPAHRRWQRRPHRQLRIPPDRHRGRPDAGARHRDPRATAGRRPGRAVPRRSRRGRPVVLPGRHGQCHQLLFTVRSRCHPGVGAEQPDVRSQRLHRAARGHLLDVGRRRHGCHHRAGLCLHAAPQRRTQPGPGAGRDPDRRAGRARRRGELQLQPRPQHPGAVGPALAGHQRAALGAAQRRHRQPAGQWIAQQPGRQCHAHDPGRGPLHTAARDRRPRRRQRAFSPAELTGRSAGRRAAGRAAAAGGHRPGRAGAQDRCHGTGQPVLGPSSAAAVDHRQHPGHCA